MYVCVCVLYVFFSRENEKKREKYEHFEFFVVIIKKKKLEFSAFFSIDEIGFRPLQEKKYIIFVICSNNLRDLCFY